MRENIGRYWRSLADGRIQCLLCPRGCMLSDGERGHCRARENRSGKMELPLYAWISSLAVDPVEKKPLRRFMPNTWTYSVGFWQCTMDCPFCQNWEISHPLHLHREIIQPDELIGAALASGCPSISFTYSEPTLHIEYVIEAMQIAHRRGLKTILVTNGNILPEPARDILSNTDATNVDLKTGSASLYQNVLGGRLKVVENFIQIASGLCHVEVTSLAVPGVQDSPEHIDAISGFLASVSPEIPLHITQYHPAWNMGTPPLPAEILREMGESAKKYLKYVYSYC